MFILTDDIESLGAERFTACFFGEALKFGQVIELAGDRLVVGWLDGERDCFTQPPAVCLGFAATQREAPLLEELKSWWLSASGAELDVCALADEQNIERRRQALMSWSFRRIAAIANLIADENRELIMQNMQLRRSYSVLQTGFSRLENFVTANKLHNPVLLYESANGHESAIENLTFWRPRRGEGRITQVLPVLSDKLSFFELLFEATDFCDGGELTVTMRLEPAGRRHDTWVIPYGDLSSGWRAFSPRPALTEVNEVILELEWSAVENAPGIALAAPRANGQYGAVPEEREGQSRSLAMRIWSGVTGVRPPTLVSNEGKQDFAPRLVADPNAFQRATHYRYSASPERDFKSVIYQHGRLIVHPHEGAVTIAACPEALPKGTTFVSAVCMTVHEQASVIEYAMAVIPEGVAPENVFCEGSVHAADACLEWRPLKPMKAARLSLTLDRPLSHNSRLYLATRLPAGLSEKWGWASWTGLEIGIHWRPPEAAVRISDGGGDGRVPAKNLSMASSVIPHSENAVVEHCQQEDS
ncbi:MAG TPA: DUF6212 domain-containing protein [Methylocella sp.]|nr:DUF6212 domain-containing protein [Methylocella sp.]